MFVTENPSIKASAKSIIKPFTTSKNKPNVRIVTGNVNSTKIGLTNKFKKDNTRATIIADI